MFTMKKAVERRAVDLNRSTEMPIGHYRGFEIKVYARRDEIQFTLTGSSTYEPEKLIYRADEKFSITGFVHRLDNFVARFEDWRQEAEETREKERREHAKAAAEQGKPFSQQTRLDALRQDVRDVMTELKLMQADDNYVSQWQPQSRATDSNADQQQERFRMRA